MHSENPKSGCRILVLFDVELAVTPLDQLRLRLPEHDFEHGLGETAQPVANFDRDALLKDIAAEAWPARSGRTWLAASDHQRSAAAL